MNIQCLILLSSVFFFAPAALALNSISRGEFGPFQTSLNHRDYGYQIIQDSTGGAPTSKIEKFEVRPGDCGISKTWNDCTNDRERSEISEKGRTNKEAEVFWYGWSLFIPDSYVSIFPAKVAFGQFHQDEGQPLWMFQDLNDGLYLEELLTKENKKYLLIPKELLRGRWHKIEIEVLWSQKQNGYFRVWHNGERKVDYQGPTKESQEVYFKYGLYRSFLSRYTNSKNKLAPPQVVFFSNVKRAKLRKGLSPNE